MRAPRQQALRLKHWLTRERAALRAVLLGGRRQGKSDLLAQVHVSLFESAEGPLPFLFRFEPPSASDPRQFSRQQAHHFAASFCQQMRAFLLRQEEVLGEPAGDLATELERPGLPLSLAELGREVLTAGAGLDEGAELRDLAASLPARFAHREGRPVCNLWDDCHLLEATSPFFAALDAGAVLDSDGSMVCSLLTGFEPQLRRLAGTRCWTALPLEPFSANEALVLAESSCKEFGLQFSREVWEVWLAVAGTSPGWTIPLIESAALRGQPIETIETLARLYAEQLDAGTLGQWMQDRWASSDGATVLGASETDRVQHGEPDSPRGEQEDEVEALSLRQRSRRSPLSMGDGTVERDWLRLRRNREKIGDARARASLVLEFLLQALHAQTGLESRDGLSRAGWLNAIEQRLCLPSTAEGRAITPSGAELILPRIFSVAREHSLRAGFDAESGPGIEAELFWCYGARLAGNTGKRISNSNPSVPVILLLVHCDTSPSATLVAEWERRLRQESENRSDRGDVAHRTLQTELWVVVPDSGSLASVGGEKRLTDEVLQQLLGLHPPDEAALPMSLLTNAADAGGPRTLGSEVSRGNPEADAVMIQEKPKAIRSKPREERPEAASSNGSSGGPPLKDRLNQSLRQVLSLSLMLASSDLVATAAERETGSSVGGADARDSRTALRMQCQKLIEELRLASNPPAFAAMRGRLRLD